MVSLRFTAALLAVACMETLARGSCGTKKAEIVWNRLKKQRKEGSVRLRGGRFAEEGSVEIYHKGKWGSVCDDEWDSNDGKVVCLQLGYPALHRVTHSSEFGDTSGKYWLDNVYCNGTETSLTKCRFDGWGVHDCSFGEAAGVICDGKRTWDDEIIVAPVKTVEIHRQLIQDLISVRLKGGRDSNEGRVEILSQGSSGWGLICGDGWSLLEANVICRHLDLGYAIAATQHHFIDGAERMTHRLSNVACYGNESNFARCLARADSCANRDDVAGVICNERLADLVVDGQIIAKTAYLEDRQMFFLQCAMEENCLASSAYRRRDENPGSWHLETRRLLRFTASSSNVGTAPFRPFIPKHLWQFHLCHMHYHSMEVFATFDIYRGKDKVAEGHKASFCLEDNKCLDSASPVYSCANYGDQGISVNCSDVYKHNIDCQWVDVTDLSPGTYSFKVSINPEFKVPEMKYDNNAVLCRLIYTETEARLLDCHLTRP